MHAFVLKIAFELHCFGMSVLFYITWFYIIRDLKIIFITIRYIFNILIGCYEATETGEVY